MRSELVKLEELRLQAAGIAERATRRGLGRLMVTHLKINPVEMLKYIIHIIAKGDLPFELAPQFNKIIDISADGGKAAPADEIIDEKLVAADEKIDESNIRQIDESNRSIDVHGLLPAVSSQISILENEIKSSATTLDWCKNEILFLREKSQQSESLVCLLLYFNLKNEQNHLDIQNTLKEEILILKKMIEKKDLEISNKVGVLEEQIKEIWTEVEEVKTKYEEESKQISVTENEQRELNTRLLLL